MQRIQQFEELIRDYIGPNKTVIDTKIDNLIPPGENYVSDIVKVDVVLENNKTKEKEELHLIAKLIVDRGGKPGPPPSVSKSEIMFYKEFLPTLKGFHERHGLPYPEFYPEFVGGRINLNGSDEADTNGVVILKNLKIEGFENVDRHVGFDLETAKMVLADLATFHAVPLAMKLVEPEVFETEIKAKCLKMQLERLESINQEKTLQPETLKNKASPILLFDVVLKYLEQNEKYAEVAAKLKKFTVEKVEKILKHNLGDVFNTDAVEPFATLMHQDMWINNTMQVIKNGVPLKNKLVDFQICNYGSPTHDLILLLFTSVQLSCLKEHFDELVKHYYETFAKVLKKCDCYDSRFSYDKFLEEFKIGGERGLIQTIFFTALIFGKKGEAINPEKLEEITFKDLPKKSQHIVIFVCEEAAKRGWF